MPTDSAQLDRNSITAGLVLRLIATQFPQWAGLPVRPVALDGWDNRTFRLGDDMSVRLPSAAGYTLQVEKEHRWLPRLAPHLPLPIPVPIARGAPGEGYPWPWSIYRWLDGEVAAAAPIADPIAFATDLAHFLVALRGVDARGGPPAGPHNSYRGAPVAVYDGETRRALAALHGALDTRTAAEVWDAALESTWQRAPVWIHGDVATGNLLVKDGKLSAVIDFGTSGVGDPACDLVIAWTFLSGAGREAFIGQMALDDATWARGRGWALWKALISIAGDPDNDPARAALNRRVINEVLADHKRATRRTS